jgi:class 3 adenylate cyclase
VPEINKVTAKNHSSKSNNRLWYQFLIPLGAIFILFTGALVFLAIRQFSELQSCLRKNVSMKVRNVETGVAVLLEEQGSKILEFNTRAVLSELIAYLEKVSKTRKFVTAQELADFCISDRKFQALALKPFGKYGYTNASVAVGKKLICVAHAKHAIVGRDLFEVVSLLSAEAKKDQRVNEFVQRWRFKTSGCIKFKQTSTFRPNHIPIDADLEKIAYHIWGNFGEFAIVAETTTYLEEFTKPIQQVKKEHGEIIDEINNRSELGINSWKKQAVYGSLAFLVFILMLSAKMYWQLVEKPLGRIMSVLSNYGEGRLDEKIDCESENEFGLIAKISNEMAGKLAKTLHSLEDTNKNLETRVLERTKELEHEKHESEKLLLSILPMSIAARIKAGEEQIVDGFPLATVLFTDFKGFTGISESVTPDRLVRELNEIFAVFDDLCKEYGIEKIKTIGDAYMAVGGIPVADETHPEKIVSLGIAMRDYIEKRLQDTNKLKFQIRIGIHSGPVIAGVIGKSKFSYDLWGDTVNIASRCESASEPMKVNLSESTYKLVKDKFQCEPRGQIEAKGKGKLPMYFAEKLDS